MPYAGLSAFMIELRAIKGVAARALEFLILTAARSSEVTGMVWSEVDLDNRTWTIPAERMKARRDHRVPLSNDAVDLLHKLPRERGNRFVFIGLRTGRRLDRKTLPYVMERMGRADGATIHGFRSSFRDWAGERTSFAHDICEAALAHVRGDQTVQAYARGDLLDKRRQLMAQWAAYCATPPTKAAGDVVALRGAR
jgi:integrase